MSIRGVLIALAIAGCADAGRPLPAWTLDVEGGPTGVAVTLPDSLEAVLHAREAELTLHGTIALQPGERGSALTLTFASFGPLAVAVDGVVLDDVGDVLVGEHRYVIPAAMSDAARLQTTVTTRYSWPMYAGGGIPLSPRLEVGAHPQPGMTAVFNRVIGIASLAVVVLLGSIFGAMYLADRHRRENLAAALTMATIIPPILSWQIGLLHPLGLAAAAIAGVAVVLVCLGVLEFVFATFELGRPPRAWVAVLLVTAAVNLANPASLWVTSLFDRLTMPIIAGFNVYSLVVLWRVRTPSHRHEARVLFAIFVFSLSTQVFEFALPGFGGPRLSGGVHLYSIAALSAGLGIGLVLARQHVMRRRVLERTADELRHQVTERSRELAGALAKLSDVPALGIDRTIDARYRVVRHLGAGGMGTVFEVERLADGQRLALKTLRAQVDAALMARFAREAQIASRLAHPNLVPVLDVGLSDGVLFLVMPLVVGGSLEGERSRFGDGAWARPLLPQIASGLAALHEGGILHRDLKPANILIAERVARIADFGLAALAEGDPLALPTLEQPLTRTGAVFGTRGYMAPELADGVASSSPASDVFAFGLIAYELLAGRRAFAGRSLTGRVPLPEIPLDAIEPALRPVLARCLDADPDRRPTAAELVAAL